jgi:threonine aldolase
VAVEPRLQVGTRRAGTALRTAGPAPRRRRAGRRHAGGRHRWVRRGRRPPPGTGFVCLENTHNSKGGTAIAAERIDAACEAAHDRGVSVHLDGARLFNAATALGTDASRIAREVDSAICCLSKGLGAPVESVLAGSEAFVAEARRVRKLLGGGMRQAGLVAAPGLLALRNRERLADDHANAAALADGLDAVGDLAARDPETNIVLVETDEPAEAFLERCEAAGVLGVPFGEYVLRLCTHIGVDREAVDEAIRRIEGLD